MAGKRVNFSARTVISPDINLKINEIGIPFEVAKILTVAEKVTTLNIKRMKKLIEVKGYPGANYIIRPDGRRKRITGPASISTRRASRIGKNRRNREGNWMPP